MAPEKELRSRQEGGRRVGRNVLEDVGRLGVPHIRGGQRLALEHHLRINPTFTILNMEKAEPLMAQCMSGTKTEADCIYYGWAICDKKLFCREAYFSGKGVAAHLANVGDLVAKLLDDGAVKLDSIEVHGPPDRLRRCKSACEALGCSFWEAQGGFAKFATPTTGPAAADSVVCSAEVWYRARCCSGVQGGSLTLLVMIDTRERVCERVPGWLVW